MKSFLCSSERSSNGVASTRRLDWHMQYSKSIRSLTRVPCFGHSNHLCPYSTLPQDVQTTYVKGRLQMHISEDSCGAPDEVGVSSDLCIRLLLPKCLCCWPLIYAFGPSSVVWSSVLGSIEAPMTGTSRSPAADVFPGGKGGCSSLVFLLSSLGALTAGLVDVAAAVDWSRDERVADLFPAAGLVRTWPSFIGESLVDVTILEAEIFESWQTGGQYSTFAEWPCISPIPGACADVSDCDVRGEVISGVFPVCPALFAVEEFPGSCGSPMLSYDLNKSISYSLYNLETTTFNLHV